MWKKRHTHHCAGGIYQRGKIHSYEQVVRKQRPFRLSDGREALLIDTVGFIRKLPHEYADMLINDILESLGAANKPVIMALNKMDMVKGGLRLAISNPNGRIFEISAVTGQGIDAMLEGIREMLPDFYTLQ